MKKYHFITGLPRSGSTLLSAILRQNPKIIAGMTSPVGGITSTLRTVMTQQKELDVLLDNEARKRILRGVFDGYYSEYSNDKIIIDTNRGWSSRIPELLSLFDDVKLVAIVRNPAWIFDSVERITRKTPLRHSGMIKPGSNIDIRAKTMMSPEGMIGGPLGNLREAIYGPDRHRILLIEYDALCLDPALTISSIYKFLDIPDFSHDFDNVEYEQEDFDEVLRTPGLHSVRGAVRYYERQTILPPDIFEDLSQTAFWREDLPNDIARVSHV